MRGWKRAVGVAMLMTPISATAQTIGDDGTSIPGHPDSLFSASRLQLLPKRSTLGAGQELRLDLDAHWKLRLEHYTLTERQSESTHQLGLHSRLSLLTTSLRLDWHPFAGRFRASAGWLRNENDLSTRLQGNGVVSYQGVARSTSDLGLLTGSARFAKQSPYLGIGWGNNRGAGPATLRYSLDIGAFRLRQPSVAYGGQGPIDQALNAYVPGDYAAWRAAAEYESEQRLGRIRYYPVISFGLVYLF
jgi:hypothetical protein